jgi:co-chaperonin GroES (HSP10)
MKLNRKVLTEHEQHILNVVAFIAKSGIVFYNARVAVIRDEEASVSKGGIIIPDQAKRKTLRGTVVGVGLGVDADGIAGYEVLDKVMFTKYNPIIPLNSCCPCLPAMRHASNSCT